MRTALCVMAIACSTGEMPTQDTDTGGPASDWGGCADDNEGFVVLPAEDVVYQAGWCDGATCQPITIGGVYRSGLEVRASCQGFGGHIEVRWWVNALVAAVPCVTTATTEVTTGGAQRVWVAESCSPDNVCREHNAQPTSDSDGFDVSCDDFGFTARVAWL